VNSSKSHVFVVDDHPLIRRSLCEAIQAQHDLELCGEAGSYVAALDAIRKRQPDVLVLDLNLGDGSGWTLADHLASENRLPPTLVLSVNDEAIYARRLLKAGVRGYLMKDVPIHEVLAAIRKILSGHLAFSDAMVTALIEHRMDQNPPPEQSMEELSDRELQVFECIRQGMNNKQIADLMKLSTKSVGTYKSRLMSKMGVRTPAQLMTLTP
jgi:DNA-binding NarL/FixJ family response regulator